MVLVRRVHTMKWENGSVLTIALSAILLYLQIQLTSLVSCKLKLSFKAERLDYKEQNRQGVGQHSDAGVVSGLLGSLSHRAKPSR